MPSTTADRLQKLQNRAARVIACLGYEVRSNDIRQQLSWKSLAELRAIHMSLMVYKLLHHMAPSYLRDHFKMSTTNDHTYALRDRETCLVLPRACTEFWQKRFVFTGAKIWNNLTMLMRES